MDDRSQSRFEAQQAWMMDCISHGYVPLEFRESVVSDYWNDPDIQAGFSSADDPDTETSPDEAGYLAGLVAVLGLVLMVGGIFSLWMNTRVTNALEGHAQSVIRQVGMPPQDFLD